MNNLRNISKILVFTTVAQKRSFTKAAEYLGISKSAVSQQISLLESELGTSLINRTTRGISLTAIGKKVFLKSESLQTQVDEIFDDINNSLNSPSGDFVITFPHSIEFLIIAPAIEQLCQEFPKLEPKLIASDQTIDLIENNIDLSIHFGELPDSNLRALPVGSTHEIFCASKEYLATQPALNNFTDLQKHRWIATNWQNKKTRVSNIHNQDYFDISLNEFSRANTLPIAIDMAIRHMGIVLLPNFVAKTLIDNGSLEHLVSDIKGPNWPIYAIHAFQNEKPIYVTRFYELVCQIYKNLN